MLASLSDALFMRCLRQTRQYSRELMREYSQIVVFDIGLTLNQLTMNPLVALRLGGLIGLCEVSHIQSKP